MWIGYCAFHLGDYQRAQQAYLDILKVSQRVVRASYHSCACGRYEEGWCLGLVVVQDYVAEDPPKEVHLFLACSLYYMQMYEEAEKVRRGSEAPVRGWGGGGGGGQRRICDSEHGGSVRRRAWL